MGTTAATGTSLEVLAPYLPYGIQMQALGGNYGRLVGLNHGRFQSPVELDVPALDIGGHLGGLCYFPYEQVLPVLYDWDSLSQNTKEHGVLLLKLAMALGWHAMGPFGVEHDHAWVYDHCERGTSPVYALSRKTFEQGLFTNAERRIFLGLHLAIGLEPGQYIGKITPSHSITEQKSPQS